MTEQPGPSDDDGIDRRSVLEISSGAIASGVAFTSVATMASAKQGRGRNENNGRRRGQNTNEEGDVDESVVFCGCSQVCACDCPVYIYVAGGEDGQIESGSGCFEIDEGQILAIRYNGSQDNAGDIICNPNGNCADFDKYDGDLSREDCDAEGVRPQDGYRCGEAFLRESCSDS